MAFEESVKSIFGPGARGLFAGAALFAATPFMAQAQGLFSPAATEQNNISAVKTAFQKTNPFLAQEPTAERPYYYIRYDEKTKAARPDRRPYEVGLHISGEPYHGDKIIVMNYIAENSKFSQMQTKLLQGTLTKLAAESKKPLLLVDVVAYNKEGKSVYADETRVVIEDNTLGKGSTNVPLDPSKDLIPPYGVVVGTSFEPGKENQVVRLFDFALMNAGGTPVTNNELLNANVKAITMNLLVTIEGYNKKLASMNISKATAVASLDRN